MYIHVCEYIVRTYGKRCGHAGIGLSLSLYLFVFLSLQLCTVRKLVWPRGSVGSRVVVSVFHQRPLYSCKLTRQPESYRLPLTDLPLRDPVNLSQCRLVSSSLSCSTLGTYAPASLNYRTLTSFRSSYLFILFSMYLIKMFSKPTVIRV